MMRSVLLAGLAMLFPAQAQAATWYMIGGNENTMSYVDLDSVRPIGGKIVAITESVYAKPLNDQVYAGTIRSEYDCAGGYFRTLEYSYFDANNRLIASEPSQTINDHKVPAKDSINESLMDFVCYRKGGEQVADPVADARRRFASK